MKYLHYASTNDCWTCTKCRVHRVDKDFQCVEGRPCFGEIDVIEKCSGFKSDAGTDRAEYNQ